MRNHDECEEAILEAQRRGKHGYAMFIAARCDFHHGPQLTTDPPPVAPPLGEVEVEGVAHG